MAAGRAPQLGNVAAMRTQEREGVRESIGFQELVQRVYVGHPVVDCDSLILYSFAVYFSVRLHTAFVERLVEPFSNQEILDRHIRLLYKLLYLGTTVYVENGKKIVQQGASPAQLHLSRFIRE